MCMQRSIENFLLCNKLINARACIAVELFFEVNVIGTGDSKFVYANLIRVHKLFNF